MNRIEWIPIELRTRDGISQSAEKGEITVPEDRRHPTKQIALRFVRIKARDPKGPPVLFLSGGPGDSGIQWASHGPFLRAFQTVASSVDMILLDQRGSGESERNLAISPPPLEREDLESRDSMLWLLERHVGRYARDRRNEGATLEGYNVVESAMDLDDLREALDVERISLWGYSYGTHLAQIATKLLGSTLERVVLCGFEGPDQTFKLPSRMDEQLMRLDRLYPGFADNLRRAIESLDAEPIEVKGKLFGGYALRHLVAGWSGISNRFTRLPALAASLAERNPEVLGENLRDYLRLWSKPLTFYLTDGASGATTARWQAIREQEPISILGDATNFPFPEAASIVGAWDMGDDLRNQVRSEKPFLILTGSLDGFTPTESAIEGMQTLPNATHVLVENAAHNDLISSPQGVDAIARFLASGESPVRDRVRIEPPTAAGS